MPNIKSFLVQFRYVAEFSLGTIVTITDNKGEIVASWDTASWEEWGDIPNQVDPDFYELQDAKQRVLDHAAELYVNSYGMS